MIDNTLYDYAISVSMQEFYVQNIPDRLKKAGAKRIAIVLSPKFIITSISNEQILVNIENPIETKYFSEVNDAFDWLNS